MYTFGCTKEPLDKKSEIRLWCTVLKKDCKDIKPEDRKTFCHGYCASCSESESY